MTRSRWPRSWRASARWSLPGWSLSGRSLSGASAGRSLTRPCAGNRTRGRSILQKVSRRATTGSLRRTGCRPIQIEEVPQLPLAGPSRPRTRCSRPLSSARPTSGRSARCRSARGRSARCRSARGRSARCRSARRRSGRWLSACRGACGRRSTGRRTWGRTPHRGRAPHRATRTTHRRRTPHGRRAPASAAHPTTASTTSSATTPLSADIVAEPEAGQQQTEKAKTVSCDS